MKKITNLFLLTAILIVVSCKTIYHTSNVEYDNYKIQTKTDYNSPGLEFLKPYSDSINKSMNDVIGENDKLLEKKLGTCTLGYFMTDAYLYIAKKEFKTNVDAAFFNYGGIRLLELPAGKITRGKLFELMPFDNLLVLQKIKGSLLKQYLDTLAMDGVINESGMTIQVSGKKVKDVKIGDKPLDEKMEYTIAISDYMIGTSALLKNIPVQNIGYLQRDALIEYLETLTQQGKKITSDKLNRVVYDE